MSDNDISNRIEKVLLEVLPEMEDHEEGDVLVEWMTICYVSNPDSENSYAYPLIYSNGVMPNHTVRGLLHTALKLSEL